MTSEKLIIYSLLPEDMGSRRFERRSVLEHNTLSHIGFMAFLFLTLDYN